MKVYVSLILSVCFIFTFAGCAQAPTETQSPSTSQTTPSQTISTPTTVPEETLAQQDPSAVYESPMAAVCLPLIIEPQVSDAGTEIAYYAHQDVILTLPDADVAQVISLDLLNRIDQTRTVANNIFDAAKANFNGQEDWSAYVYSITYAPTRIDENVLSFTGTELTHDGNSRASHTSLSINYDLTTGEALTLKTIFHEENFAEALCEMIIDGLKSKADELYGDYDTIIMDMFKVNTPINNWYFSKDGLCFYFSPYEIAPYTAGTIVSQIPYENLSGLLKDAYFPGEQFSYTGNILVNELDDRGIPEGLSQFAELKLDNSGNKLILTAEGSVSNVTILYNAGITEFIDETIVLSMAGMGPTDAIILEVTSESASGNIKVIFDSNGESHTLVLTKDANGTWSFTK